MIRSDYEIPKYLIHTPERALLAAVLERAWRDLDKRQPREQRRHAIAWFLSKEMDVKRETTGFSFCSIVDLLQLGANELNHLLEGVAKAVSEDEANRDLIECDIMQE